jgi:predicted nuclease of predicted toxin-antitoxin system
MPPNSFKPKLLLDEGFPRRNKLPNLNKRFDTKHITGDFNKTAWTDDRVYKFAIKEKRLIVTFNKKDFKEFATFDEDSGVIGVSDNLTNEQIDKKLLGLLKRRGLKLYGKFISITGQTKLKEL